MYKGRVVYHGLHVVVRYLTRILLVSPATLAEGGALGLAAMDDQ